MDNNIDLSKQKKTETATSRRSFLKKTVYVAPTLIVLGSLSRPKDANAGFGPPPSAPLWSDGKLREKERR